MSLILVGTSHRVADAAFRGRLAFAPADAERWLRDAGASPDLGELLLVSTCNRTEVYAVGADAGRAETAVRAAVVRARGGDWLAPGPHRYRLHGAAAARHLCRVACGLDSLLVGEPEILGQVRAGAALARGAGALGPVLDRLARAALDAGRRARTETRIGVGATSAAAAAVALAERALGGLAGRDALVIGAGQAASLALDRLARRKPARLRIVNRTPEAARRLAAGRAEAHGLDALPALLAEADAVIAAASAPEPLVTPATAGPALAARAGRPLVVVDLCVPPVIDLGLTAAPPVTLYGVDDLREAVGRTLDARRREAPLVERIAAEHADAAWLAITAAGPPSGRRDRPLAPRHVLQPFAAVAAG
jgi:glutamyl-tRNA reductase